MKKLLIILMIFMQAGLADAQTKSMTSVMGIELGSTRAQVKAKMAEKQPLSKIYNETDISLSFENVRFGGNKTLLVMCQFTDDNKMHTCHIFVEPSDCKEIFSKYDEIVKDLSDKYGTSEKTLEDYKYPYSIDDKYNHTEVLVKRGYVTMLTLWTFDSRNTPDNTEDDNGIMVSLDKTCSVKVTYQDGLLIDEAVAKSKAKNSQDY